MKVPKVVKVVSLLLLLLVVCSEAFFRLKFKEELKDQFSPLIYKPDPITGYRFIPNSVGEISKPGIPLKSVKVNSLGFFTPEFNIKKKPGTFRIVLVGTSIASGIWMKGTESYPNQLRKMLGKQHKNVEIINCSLDGQGLGDGLLEMIKTEVVKYEPDLILYELSVPVTTGSMFREAYRGYLLQYYSDSTKVLSKKIIDEVEDKKVLRFLYDHSYTFRAFCRNYAFQNMRTKSAKLIRTYKDKISRIEELREYDYTFGKSVKLLKSADSVVAKNGSKLVLVAYGTDKKGILPYLEKSGLTPVFLNCKFEDSDVSLPDSHLNEKGHGVIADSLYKQMIRTNFFK